MKETIHFQRVDRLCNAGACARGFSDSASIKGYIMIHQSDEFPSTDPSVHPCHVWSLCIQASCGCPHCLHNTLACSQVCLRRDPLQMESSRRVVSWDGAIYWRLSTGTWLGASGCWESNWFSSPEKVVGSSKQHLRKEKLKIEHHQRMRKVQRFLFGLGGGPFGSVGCLVNFTQDRFGTPWQSIVHGAKHSMPSAYDQKHKETSVDVTLWFMLAAGSQKGNWRK